MTREPGRPSSRSSTRGRAPPSPAPAGSTSPSSTSTPVPLTGPGPSTTHSWPRIRATTRPGAPRDARGGKGRALTAPQPGGAAQAEDDLPLLLRDVPEQADELLARRALARRALGRGEAAEEDAAGTYRRRPSPSRERLW